MYGKELNERNPLRLFEHSIHGGLGRGNIGVVVARHGIGKTAFLVGIALDDAMRGRKCFTFRSIKPSITCASFTTRSSWTSPTPPTSTTFLGAARDGTQPHHPHLCGQIVHDPQASSLDQLPEGVCPLRARTA